MKRKIVSIVGTRPNSIKYAPLSGKIRKEFDEILIHTGQHYDYEMNKVFFDGLKIPEPDYHLEIGSGSHGYQMGEMMRGIEEVLIKEKPDLILVFGDTNSTFAGALASSRLNISVGHIESGLRSFDKSMPEEINRVLTDHCSDLLFCPTETAVGNLRDEGICDGVYLTGDVMVDTLNYNKKIAEKSDILDKLGLESREYLVATIHRVSNTDNKKHLKDIVNALCEIDELIVFPMHPRAEKFLRMFGVYNQLEKHVDIIKPLGYHDFMKLMSNSKKILTDSGGIQKEAYLLKVPCVTLRENTEWVETIEDGWNVLAGVDRERIVKLVTEFEPKGKQRNIFGVGNASENILRILRDYPTKSKKGDIT